MCFVTWVIRQSIFTFIFLAIKTLSFLILFVIHLCFNFKPFFSFYFFLFHFFLFFLLSNLIFSCSIILNNRLVLLFQALFFLPIQPFLPIF